MFVGYLFENCNRNDKKKNQDLKIYRKHRNVLQGF